MYTHLMIYQQENLFHMCGLWVPGTQVLRLIATHRQLNLR